MATVETAIEIRPFQFDSQEEALEDLRRRIEATRLPSKELVEDREGFQNSGSMAAPVGCAGFDGVLEVHARAGYQIALGFATH